jgi:hypothetical protein
VATTPLRQLSIGEVLDVAINIAWKKAGVLVPAVAIVVVPTQVVSTLISISAGSIATQTTDPVTGETVEHFHSTALTATLITLLISLAAVALATGACFKAVRDSYLGEPATVRGSLAYALRRLHSLVWVTLLAGIVTALGLILVLVGSVWLWTSFAVAVPALMAEGLKGRRALGRSFRLVRGRWWATFAVMLLTAALTGVARLAISGALIGLLVTGAGSTARDIANAVGAVLADVITTPFTAASVTVLYFDLRVRKEGFDLEQQIEQMAMPGVEALEP